MFQCLLAVFLSLTFEKALVTFMAEKTFGHEIGFQESVHDEPALFIIQSESILWLVVELIKS